MPVEKDYTVLGVSSGGGVSLFPFKDHLVANYEPRSIFHSKGEPQWKSNFGDIPFEKHWGDPPFKPVDVMISSPDCGSGSILRYSRAKKLGDHKKNDSLLMFFRGVQNFRPKIILFENLENLFRSYPKLDFLDQLENYRVKIFLTSVTAFGNSQLNRKRLIAVAFRNDLPEKLFRKCRLPKGKQTVKSCGELYGDLKSSEIVEIGHFRENPHVPIAAYAGRKMTPAQMQHEWRTRLKGKKRWYVEASEKKRFSTAPGIYRNVKSSFPATVRKSNRQFDHYGWMLTPRQIARIQGVPDNFYIHYDPSEPLYWLNKGRAVVAKTPPMEISTWFKKFIEKHYKLWNSKPYQQN
jgi:site-specific DNA-cytosine methylase